MKGIVCASATLLGVYRNFTILCWRRKEMRVFVTWREFMRWTAHFGLCIWRLRLKVNRAGA